VCVCVCVRERESVCPLLIHHPDLVAPEKNSQKSSQQTFYLGFYVIHVYGVATIRKLLKITGLFCKSALQKRLYSAKETYNFKEPTNRSHLKPEFKQQKQRLCPQSTATRCTILENTATQCSTLQHTATSCNTLHYTAAHCIKLQHTAAHGYTLQRAATHYSTLQHAATHCNTLPHTATHCNTLYHTKILPDCQQQDSTLFATH